MKENYFSKRMKDKSDAELKQIVFDPDSGYVEEAKKAAIWELEQRNQKTEEIEQVEEALNTSKVEEPEQNTGASFFSDPNILDDPELPKLYSKKAITLFSVVFSTIFGAALLIVNLHDAKKRDAVPWVLLFALAYTVVTIVIVNSLTSPNTLLTVTINFGGAVILTELFWNRFLGKDFKHRKKSVIKPLIISIFITIPFLLAIIYGA